MKMNLTTSEKNRGLVRFLLMSLLLSILILPAHAQDRVTVSGQLTDSSQTPLIGASVIEKGTTNGVTTDADGRYQISVKPDGVIDFSFIGYKPQSLAVMNRTEINVTMEEDATMIGEVVAIGYGSQRKEDLSMAVSTVKVDDAARSRAADLGTLLQGRMPGVTIQQSGDPLQKASFTVRGRGSKGNDDGTDKSAAYSRDNIGPTSGDGVLVVVDGVPGAPYMAEDIETITILKDAASAAIYGASVGSSGVILITTRQAQAGKTRVNVNVSVGFERAMNLPTMLNAQQFCDVWGKAVENSPGSSLPNLANPQVYAGANVTRTDWLDEIFRTGLTQHYAVSITGGSETLSSILSVTYDKKEGTLLNTWSQALGAKLHTEFKPVKWLKLSERVNFEYSNGQGNISTSHTGPIYGAMWFPASASVYDRDANGNIVYGDDGKPKWGGIASSADMASGVEGPNIVNPVAQLETMHRRYPRTKIFSTTSLEIKPITSLTLKSEFTADLDMREEDEFSPVIDVPGGSSTSSREQFNYNNFHYLWETTATYAQVFGRHHISAMAGFTTDYKKFRYYSPKMGMYISSDPIGLAGGNPTLYGYVFDPNTQVDPFGLDCDKVNKARARQHKMLQDNKGFNISPTDWDAYPSIGRNGTFITDCKGALGYFGNFKKGDTITISSVKAAKIESDMGLNPGSLQNGFKIREVSGISSMNPRSPLEGNEYFLGGGQHLPGGAPEMVINSIPTTDNASVTTILTVLVK